MNENNYNPAGNPRLRPLGEPKIAPPKPDVAARQDPKHTTEDFKRDLGNATRRVGRSS